MSDDVGANALRPPTQFPSSPTVEVVFADYVWSLTNSPAVVKYYLARFDPSFSGDGRVQPTPVVQIVMPMDGFISMVAFFEAQLKILVAAGVVSEARLAQARAVFEQPQT
jgi:hypothetical protein